MDNSKQTTLVLSVGFGGKSPTITKVGPLPLEEGSLSFLRYANLRPTEEQAKSFTDELTALVNTHLSEWEKKVVDKKKSDSLKKDFGAALDEALANDGVSV